MIPLICFAGYVWAHVNSNLNENASRRMAADTKGAAIIIQERLYILDESLVVLAASVDTLGKTRQEVESNFPETVDRKFDGIKIIRWDDESLVVEGGHSFVVPTLTEEERKQLVDGNCLILPEDMKSPLKRTLLARGLRSRAGEDLIIVVLPRFQYLWEKGALVGHGADIGVALRDGTLLFGTNPDLSKRPEFHAVSIGDDSQGQFNLTFEDTEYMNRYWMLNTKPAFGKALYVFQHRKVDEILAPLEAFKTGFLQTILLTLSLVTLLCSSQVRRIMIPIEALDEATKKLSGGDLETRVQIDSKDEFENLGQSFNAMATSLGRNRQKLRTLEGIGLSLSKERKASTIIEGLVRGVDTLFDCDGCAVHLTDSEGQLELASLAMFSRNIFVDGSDPWTGVHHEHVDEILTAFRPNDPDHRIWQDMSWLEERHSYSVHSVLGLPLRDHRGDLIGTMLLLNAYDEAGEPREFEASEIRMATSLASQAGVAMTNLQLVAEFKNMFDSLIELLAVAIDEKSEYTGGHCRRVPILTMLIADAVTKSDLGLFRHCEFSEEELYELHVAALLHDCGKVTTPVHVVDKATKLETLYDRISLIETRVEVVKRDREIALLRKAVAAGNPAAGDLNQIDAALESDNAQLQEDLEFIRNSNTGVEYMPPEKQKRIVEIGNRHSWRGLSGKKVPFLSAEEIENLTIAKGTLTAPEREVINYHVVATVKMLEKLPFPKGLERVPEIAGAHHERMDGKGYPMGLSKHDITLQGRILGLADIFEALTAADRPYKTAKTLAESLKILAFMTVEGHIDPELFELFVREKVYLEYGKSHLTPAQIDEVDEEKILNIALAEA
ncbi:MAG: HD domain-containing phosphohydrolase [Planctomycetota bacterium]